jgi:hypothetical protein
MFKIFRKKEKKRRHIIKHILEPFMYAAALVMIWRGVWGLMDAFLLPSYPVLSSLVSLLIGLLIMYIDDLSLSELHHKSSDHG